MTRRLLIRLGWGIGLLGAALLAPAAPLLLDAARAGDALVAVGERGIIERSIDGGATWIRSERIVSTTLCGISFGDKLHGWAVGHGAVVLHTTDGGETWEHQFTGDDVESPLLDVLALDTNHVIAVGAFGAYYETRDAGTTWEQQWIIDEDAHLNRISRTHGGALFIAGEFGTLLRSTDAGDSWENLSTGDGGSLYGVLELADRTLLTYGLRGRVHRSTDDGETWTEVRTPGTGLLMTGIELVSTNTVILAGQGRTWWTSQNAGQTFHAASTITPAVAELLLTPDGRLLTFGEGGAGFAPSAP